ncbi:unnamed protein product, partial [Prorocentrum cordatum]
FRDAALPTPVELLPRASDRARLHIEEWDRWAQPGDAGEVAVDSQAVSDEELSSAYCESFDTWFQDRGCSGTAAEYTNGSEDHAHGCSEGSVGSWNLLSSKGGEVKLGYLSPEGREQLRAPDEAEWAALNRQEGTFSAKKAKSRWCARGFRDPDAEKLITYSPTPQSESTRIFAMVLLSCDMDQAVVDWKNAFSQFRPLKRSGGPIYAAPCEGLAGVHVLEGCLIELMVALCGLGDAPWEWHVTSTSFLSDLDVRKLLLEPCYWTKREKDQLVAQVLIEVDDLRLGSVPGRAKRLRESPQGRFIFGKWCGDEAEFAGRRQRLSTAESRPEISGTVSILASSLNHATIDDVFMHNKAAQLMRDMAAQYIAIWMRGLSQVVAMTACNAASVGSEGPAQNAWLAGTADPQLDT